jgi:cytochrome c oxidase subunit 3
LSATEQEPRSTADHGSSPLAHQFANLEQQQDTNHLGMWMFLSTEIMFFGGMFGAYAVYRQRCADGFVAGSEMLLTWIGALNTAVLIASSLTMAMAVRAAQTGKPGGLGVFGWLVATIILGFVFLGIKFSVEWPQDYREGLIPIGELWHPQEALHELLEERQRAAGIPHEGGHETGLEGTVPKVDPTLVAHTKVFYSMYFGMTGLHALHMIIGFFVLGTLAYFAWYGAYTPKFYGPVEVTGLYWHFVDIIWIFLFPLLYLIRGSH